MKTQEKVRKYKRKEQNALIAILVLIGYSLPIVLKIEFHSSSSEIDPLRILCLTTDVWILTLGGLQ